MSDSNLVAMRHVHMYSPSDATPCLVSNEDVVQLPYGTLFADTVAHGAASTFSCDSQTN